MSTDLSLRSLPLFPLSTVLFPGGLLPLRVFEVRYLDMVRRCHETGAPFGVVALIAGNEVRQAGGASEVFHDVGTLARIDAFESPQTGLIMVHCVGEQRFRISRREQLRHGLWVADADPIADDMEVEVPEDLKPDADALAQLIETLQQRRDVPDAPPLPLSPPWKLDDCGWVSNRWCELLPLSTELKQRLMALENPVVRLELIGDILARNGIA
ncbi:LON peptidase substrate-binding domain-containing protein [Xylophilus sp. GOD-11R]|uniref:LON peptidase substrate-binding domain-containing protein n=1 Tax=Xylophilus sp. GOD-11R TaxID=3089814 RepID=UPI00298D2926|nr:LON peptidase substrate-binding domain-containing protein [Xylophilus sp. GOD-11R]WPB55131.1 LON peptidase substrate-binding domain-containing protein [Xylophilus sp. GOD-11R]